jgi:hypothetical protein
VPEASAPLKEYAAIVAGYSAGLGAFLALERERLPVRLSWEDIALVALAAHKVSRLIAKDEVTKFVRAPVTEDAGAEEPAPEGARRALGKLLTCSSCLGLWASTALAAAIVLRPREGRFVCSIFSAHAIADGLNAAFVRLKP